MARSRTTPEKYKEKLTQKSGRNTEKLQLFYTQSSVVFNLLGGQAFERNEK